MAEKTASKPAVGERPIAGNDLFVPLECPKCSKRGWAHVDQLDRGMRCLECRTWFQVNRSGESLLRRNPREREFKCPRCHLSGFAVLDASDHATCTSCQLPLRCGPDGKLYSIERVAQLWREMQEKALLHRQQEQAAKGAQPSVLPSRIVLISGGAAGLVLLALLIYWIVTPTPPTSLAVQLVNHCLAGEWEKAELLVGEDEYELSDFQKWRVTHFASIQSRFRPNDSTSVKIEVVESDADQLVVRTIIRSKILGTRTMIQYWTKEETGWSFDATASLRDPRKVNAPHPQPPSRE